MTNQRPDLDKLMKIIADIEADKRRLVEQLDESARAVAQDTLSAYERLADSVVSADPLALNEPLTPIAKYKSNARAIVRDHEKILVALEEACAKLPKQCKFGEDVYSDRDLAPFF